jgi:hypothetical protein
MRHAMFVALGALLFVACADRPTEPELFDLPVFNRGPHGGGAAVTNFGAPLSSGEEVTEIDLVFTSPARGNAIFQLDRHGTLSYQLIVANIENVTMAHIHVGAAGTNGPVVVWLYPSTAVGAGPPGGGRLQGVIARGTITESDLVGMLAGEPLGALIDLVRAGLAYVNVHTDDGVAPPNTGPGDFPGGEVRGQLRHRGR